VWCGVVWCGVVWCVVCSGVILNVFLQDQVGTLPWDLLVLVVLLLGMGVLSLKMCSLAFVVRLVHMMFLDAGLLVTLNETNTDAGESFTLQGSYASMVRGWFECGTLAGLKQSSSFKPIKTDRRQYVFDPINDCNLQHSLQISPSATQLAQALVGKWMLTLHFALDNVDIVINMMPLPGR